MDNAAKKQQSVVAFFLGEVRCGVAAGAIQEIMAMPLLTPVPGSSAFLRGIFAYKGSIVPVFSFFAICGTKAESEERICLILQDDSGVPFGITVPQVDQLLTEAFAEAPDDAEAIRYGSVFMKPVCTRSGVLLMMNVGKTYAELLAVDGSER